MNIYFYKDFKKGNKIYEQVVRSISQKRLIPVIGSGFSAGCKTLNGSVPSVKMMTDKLLNLLLNYYDFTEEDIEDYRGKSFSDIADVFISEAIKDSDCSKMGLNNFFEYLNTNYNYVVDIDLAKKEFLLKDWPYLYTLNYDNAIESVLQNTYEVITPYSKLNRNWVNNQKHIIKLHGDAKKTISTGELKYCIMSKSQYLNAITSKENSDIHDMLIDDFASNDLIFIGCGLKDEFDLIFATDTKFSHETAQASIYIYYDSNPESPLKKSEIKALEIYGINNILRISPGEMYDFYASFKNLFASAQKSIQTDRLSSYTDFNFTELSAGSDADLFCFFSNMAIPQKNLGSINRQICLPSFFFKRDICNTIAKDFSSGTSIVLLSGNRFSGKTCSLIQLYKEAQSQRKRVYFFTDVVFTDQIIDNVILKKKDVLLLFDTQVVSNRAIRKICENHYFLKENNIKNVFAIHRSDRNFLKNFDANLIERQIIKFYMISPKLSENELDVFNEKLKLISLTKRYKNESFLDYAIRLEESSLRTFGRKLAYTNIIDSTNSELLECMIVLSVNSSLSSDEANFLDIRDSLSFLCETQKNAIEKDYMTSFERDFYGHSGMKFVCNSTYWVFRCLSNFAAIKSNYPIIAEAVRNIIKRYMEKYISHEGYIDRALYPTIMPYYFLENLQRIFFCDSPYKGSLELPEQIYSNLKDILGDEYQFLHQTAKCKLRLSRRQSVNEKEITLEESNHIILRAQQLAVEYNGKNVEYTLAHMEVTKSLILTNFLRYCEIPETKLDAVLSSTINSYYKIYVEYIGQLGDEDRDFDENEMNDVEWFLQQFQVKNNRFRQRINNKELQQRLSQIYQKKWGNRFQIDWSK